jgi:serine/threonine protein kinase/tetratricopeptide (TPR) repeat protein
LSTDPSAALNELVQRWRELRAQGRSASAEELCAACPEMVEALQTRLRELTSQELLPGRNRGGETVAEPAENAQPPAGEDSYCTRDGSVEASGHGTEQPWESGLVPFPHPRRRGVPRLPEIPGYEILTELGRGGMGVVYKARHIKLKRLVALKMLLAGYHARAGQVGRFRAEAEAVARLRHRNIVQVYEVGEHAGLPFFSLEYADGGSLEGKVGNTPVPVRDAAGLVEVLARAMHAAHQHGVVHRDLKPANILLCRKPESPPGEVSSPLADFEPKVTDFGLAKALDEDQGRTIPGDVLGTPTYMAPEQAAGQAGRAGPLADVHGLGAILYYLLTGRPPFQGASTAEILDQVRGQEPVAPCRLRPGVPRDLETVCLKCLRKDPARRYASAGALADDLRRFLDNRPVLARPVSRGARLWRWARRNPVVAGLSAALLVVLGVSLAGLTHLWLRAENEATTAVAERRRAEGNAAEARKQQGIAEAQRAVALAEAAKAGKIAEVLAGMFEASDPLGLNGAPLLAFRSGDTLTAREILDRGAARVVNDLKAEPEVRAKLMDTLGGVYCTLGLTEKAQPLLEEALAIHRRVLPADDAELANNLHNLGWLHHQRGNYAEAEKFYREALDIRRRQAGDTGALSTTLFTLAWLLADEEDFAAAERLFKEVIALRRQHLGDAHRDVAVAYAGLASLYLNEGRFQEAVGPSLQAVAILRKVEQNKGLAESIVLFQQGLLAREMPPIAGSFLGWGGLADAERHFRRCLELTRRILGNRHPYTALVLHELAHTLERRGQDAEAEKCFRACLAIARPYGLEHPKVQIAVNSFATLLERRGKGAEAQELLREMVAASRKHYGPDHPLVANALLIQAQHEERSTRELLLREALAMYRKAAGPPRRHLVLCLNRLSVCLGPGRAAEAEKLGSEAVTLGRQCFGPEHPLLGIMLCNLASFRMDCGRHDGVESLLRDALAIVRKDAAARAGTARSAWRLLGRYYRDIGQADDASAAALERRKLAGNSALQLYEVALDFARCAALPKITAGRRRHYEDLALATLQQARKRGFADIRRLQSDADLRPLRDRQEFRALLAGLDGPMATRKPGP